MPHSLNYLLRCAPRVMQVRILGPVLVWLLLPTLAAAQAATYVPEHGDTVIATLSKPVQQLAQRIRREQASVSSIGTASPAAQLRKVLASYEIAVLNNDERAYGHTLSLLANWPAPHPMPDAALLIKAAVLQHKHDFSSARIELESLLSRQPGHLQALQMQAQISLVMGDYRAAAASCGQLDQHGFPIPGFNCQAQLDGLTGKADSALAALSASLADHSLSASNRLELHISAADIAARLDQAELALHHYNKALQLNPGNHYLLVNLSEVLLANDSPQTVATLLQQSDRLSNSPELQLLHVLALRQTDPDGAIAAENQLEQLVSALKLREEDRPHKLLARYALDIELDAKLALEEASANWQQQKEPSDAWLLARAALAADGNQALRKLHSWIRHSGLQDHRLNQLLANRELDP